MEKLNLNYWMTKIMNLKKNKIIKKKKKLKIKKKKT